MPSNFQDPQIVDKLKRLKLLILDIDGVMTDGSIFWVREQGWTRNFNVNDGWGVIQLMRAGIHVAVISAGDTPDVRERARMLGIERAYFGQSNKLEAFDDLMGQMNLSTDDVAYMGDDVFDIPVLERVGLSITVPNGVRAVKEKVHCMTEVFGGKGAVREVSDAILMAQDKALF